MIEDPLSSLAVYSRFLVESVNRPSIRQSTLHVWPLSRYTGVAEGEIHFHHGLRLRIREELDFDDGLITSYGYEAYHGVDKLYWYDDFPHPNDPTLASTHPHHKHIPPDIKRHRVPAPGLSFSQPNLPFLIAEIESLLQEKSVSINPYSPDNQWLALVRIQAELPELVAPAGRPGVEAALSGLLARLSPANDEQTRLVAALDLQDLVAPHPAARTRMLNELHLQAGLQSMFSERLTRLAAELGVGAAAVTPSFALALTALAGELAEPVRSTDQPRLVEIGVGGVEGGRVVRLRNLIIDFRALLTLLAGAVLTQRDMASAPDPVTVLAGVCLIITGLVDGLAIDLSVDDATVFWGFIQVFGRDRRAGEAEIVEWTNRARAGYKLDPLAAGEVAASLRRLVTLGSLRRVDDEWELADEYRITG